MAETEEMTYFAKFKVDASEFLDGISSMRSEFLTFVSGITASVAIATVALDQYTKLVQQYGQMANNLNDLSYATGISTDELQKFHYAATLSGDDMGMVDSMLGKLTLSMGQFSDKTSQASKAFTTLGVDPTGKSASDVFLEVAEAMDNIPDAGTRASIAIDILGRSYKDSLPYMEDYIKNQDKIKDAVTYSPDELQAMSDYKQGLDDLGHSWEVFWGKLFFGKPTPTKESVDSMIALWKNQYGYTDEQIKKAMVDTYGLEALQKIGYYTSDTTATESATKSTFDNPYKNLNEDELQLQKLKNTLADYNTKMDEAQQSGDKSAFDEAAMGARATQLAIDKLSESTKTLTTDTKTLAQTFNQMFSNSLASGSNDATGQWQGTTGLDAAGFSDLGNMTAEQLQAVVDRSSKGGSKAMAERAQMYLTLMGGMQSTATAGTAAGSDSTKLNGKETTAKSLAEQASVDTKTLSSELTKQADLFTGLNDKIKAGWITLEKDGLTHYAALSELSRIRSQAELDFMAACVNFAGENPIIQNKVIMSANGSDWTPAAFTAVTAPKLAAADFSGVSTLLGASGSGSSSGSGSGNSGKAATVSITIQNDAAVTSKVTTAASETIAADVTVNGGTAGL